MHAPTRNAVFPPSPSRPPGRRRALGPAVLSALLAAALAMTTACGDNLSPGSDPELTPDAAPPEPDAGPVLSCTPGEVPCIDDVILDLSLHDDRTSAGDVVNTADGAGFISTLDATAGGFGQSNDNAFLYLAFDETGLVKLDIDDETALDSDQWHIAARRFIVRLNGGVSGPGCVGAAPQTGQTFDAIAEAPDDFEPIYDAFYDGECSLVEDGTGLPGSPLVALTGWWAYTSCVTTTGTPFIVQLTDGRFLKLEMLHYYETGQADCNTTGNPGSTSGMLGVRWQFLP